MKLTKIVLNVILYTQDLTILQYLDWYITSKSTTNTTWVGLAIYYTKIVTGTPFTSRARFTVTRFNCSNTQQLRSNWTFGVFVLDLGYIFYLWNSPIGSTCVMWSTKSLFPKYTVIWKDKNNLIRSQKLTSKEELIISSVSVGKLSKIKSKRNTSEVVTRFGTLGDWSLGIGKQAWCDVIKQHIECISFCNYVIMLKSKESTTRDITFQ